MKRSFKYNVSKHLTQAYLILFFALISIPQLLARSAGGVELIKTIQKSYRVEGTDLLEVTNKYGKVHLNTWDKTYISVSITITAHGKTEQDAQRRMNEVNIEERRRGGHIQLLTETSIGGGEMVKLGPKGVSVSYEINMPTTNPVRIANKFGNVYIEDRRGNVGLDLSNGNLIAGKLTGDDNRLKVSFGNTDLDYIQTGKIDFSYGRIVIGEAGVLALKTDGADIEIEEVERLQLLRQSRQYRDRGS